jgi:hypothetical protein
MLTEAKESLQQQMDDGLMPDPEINGILKELDSEFFVELGLLQGFRNRAAGIRNVYVRGTEISGPPLRDAFHFGQTIADDFGRPYGQGMNAIGGLSLHAEYGLFAINLQGEYQDSRALFPYNQNALNTIAAIDSLPVQPLPGVSSLSRLRPIEATVSMKVFGWQATFGEQSQWWGQARSTSLILSNNAEAPTILLITHDKPIQLPSFLSYLGKMNNTFFLGQLRGHHYVRGPEPTFALYGTATKTLNPQPFIWGDQWDLKMSPNFELGFSVVCVWAGYGRPATIGTWLHTFSFHGNAQPVDPGKRYGGAHFSYRLPYLRDYVTLYADSMSNDEPTPIVYPTRSAMNPGLYIAQFPHLHNLDARFEAVYTNIPNYKDGVGSIYSNTHYASGYRNASQVIGSWVGRAGTGLVAKSTYWFSGANTVDFSVRRQFNDQHMIGGGDLTDVSAGASWRVAGPWRVEGEITGERWRFPILRPSAVRPVTATIGLSFTPPPRGAN